MCLPNVPDGVVLLHCGDLLSGEGKKKKKKFSDFLGKVTVKYKHIVVISGIHELNLVRLHELGEEF